MPSEPRLVDYPESKCPYCGARLNYATPLGEPSNTPDPGSVSLCIRCCQWLVFDRELKLRKPTQGELVTIKAEPFLQDVQRKAQEFVIERNAQQ
jgi:hypothetical protein